MYKLNNIVVVVVVVVVMPLKGNASAQAAISDIFLSRDDIPVSDSL